VGAYWPGRRVSAPVLGVLCTQVEATMVADGLATLTCRRFGRAAAGGGRLSRIRLTLRSEAVV